jgi:2-dehydropantoate 2-reductase
VITHVEGTRFALGELDGSVSERVQDLSELLQRAGFKAPVLEDIRSEIWLKAWGNLTFNPISALTHSTLEDICRFPLTRALAANMMAEAQAVAEKLGVTFRVPLEKRIAGAERVGRHKTSMLQDLEAGKRLETDALIGSVVELGALTGTPTPCISSIYAAVELLSKTVEHEGVKVTAQPLTPAMMPAAPPDWRQMQYGMPPAAAAGGDD